MLPKLNIVREDVLAAGRKCSRLRNSLSKSLAPVLKGDGSAKP
jgi:hypothetical protein